MLTPSPAGANTRRPTIRDEMFDRDYQAGRDALNDGIDRLVRTIGAAFRALARIQFDAPWRKTARRDDKSHVA